MSFFLHASLCGGVGLSGGPSADLEDLEPWQQMGFILY